MHRAARHRSFDPINGWLWGKLAWLTCRIRGSFVLTPTNINSDGRWKSNPVAFSLSLVSISVLNKGAKPIVIEFLRLVIRSQASRDFRSPTPRECLCYFFIVFVCVWVFFVFFCGGVSVCLTRALAEIGSQTRVRIASSVRSFGNAGPVVICVPCMKRRRSDMRVMERFIETFRMRGFLGGGGCSGLSDLNDHRKIGKKKVTKNKTKKSTQTK